MGLSDLPEALAQLLSGNQLAVSARFVLVKLQRVGLLFGRSFGFTPGSGASLTAVPNVVSECADRSESGFDS